MLRRSLVYLALASAAIAFGGLLGALMLADPGYVLLAYRGLTLETSLWFALAALLAAWAVVAGVSFVARRFQRSGEGLSNWFRARRSSGARQQARRGQTLLAEGRWEEAGKALLASAERLDEPLASLIGAARAANQRGLGDERDRILDRAEALGADAAFAAALVRSELQQASGQWRQSLVTLEGLRAQAPRHPLVLARLLAALRTLGDWEAVADLAPTLPADVDADADGTVAALWQARLTRARDSAEAAEHATEVWQQMPRRLHDHEPLVLDYVDVLAASGASDRAESVLRRALKSRWRPALVARYGELRADVAQQLATAQDWLKHHPQDAALFLSLGRLAVAADNPALGFEYLETSLARQPGRAVLLELGRLSRSQGRADAAADYFERAAQAGEGEAAVPSGEASEPARTLPAS